MARMVRESSTVSTRMRDYPFIKPEKLSLRPRRSIAASIGALGPEIAKGKLFRREVSDALTNKNSALVATRSTLLASISTGPAAAAAGGPARAGAGAAGAAGAGGAAGGM